MRGDSSEFDIVKRLVFFMALLIGATSCSDFSYEREELELFESVLPEILESEVEFASMPLPPPPPISFESDSALDVDTSAYVRYEAQKMTWQANLADSNYQWSLGVLLIGVELRDLSSFDHHKSELERSVEEGDKYFELVQQIVSDPYYAKGECILKTEREMGRFLLKPLNPDTFTGRVKEVYPDALSYFVISRAYFDSEYTKAIFSMGSLLHGDWGSSSLYFAEKVDGKWVIDYSILLWVA